MTSVERVKTICKERKIAISKLESDLGFSNGYIGQLRKGVFPNDRMYAIAKYLDVSPEFIAGQYEINNSAIGKKVIEICGNEAEAIQKLTAIHIKQDDAENMLHGKYQFTDETIIQIARHLSVSFYDFFKNENEKSPLPEGNELSKAKQDLIEEVQSMDEDQVLRMLEIIRLIKGR